MRATCRLSGKSLRPVIDLGIFYISNFFSERDDSASRAPLRLGIGEESGLLQLMDSIDRAPLFKTYWYRSGTNNTMRKQLSDVVAYALNWARLRESDVVLDIGCNDGTLLNCYPAGIDIIKVGIDPAENLAEEARSCCRYHAVGFFSKDVFKSLVGGRKAKIITSIAMFYGLEDPHAFVSDLVECLADDGIWVLQLSYTPLMIIQNAFDNICHEHLEYYTLMSLNYLLQRHGLRVIDVDFNDTNAGSIRVVIAKESNPMKDAPLFLRDIGQYRCQATLTYEHKLQLDDPGVYLNYMKKLCALKQSTLEALRDIRRHGKSVMGYGASTKGNTLLQFYGLGPGLIDAIAERQAQKCGLLTPGSWIPIISEEEMRRRKPDYLLVLPWHFINEFLEREQEFLRRGGHFIIPLPELRIV